jgi:hypothetical protein
MKQYFTLKELQGINGMFFDKKTADSFRRYFKERHNQRNHHDLQEQDYQRKIQQLKDVLKTTQESYSKDTAKLNHFYKNEITVLENKLKNLMELAEKQEAEKESSKNKVLLLTSSSVSDKVKVLFADSKFEFFVLNDIKNHEQLINMAYIFMEVLTEDPYSVDLYEEIQHATVRYPNVKFTPIQIPKHLSELKESIVIDIIKTVLGKENGSN